MLRLTILCCLTLLSAGCGSIPWQSPAPGQSSSLKSENGFLAGVADGIRSDLGAGESAFWLLDRAEFSFETRLALADRAAESLDIQYFIWERDPTSRLYAHKVLLAANRGVRVRILLDDLTVNGQDDEFLSLAGHPNISVRVFNPWKTRRNLIRVPEFFLKFGQLNHRMHNKTIIADGQFAILGGRNIGDRYFGVWDDFVQNDLDIMAVGPVANAVASSFDLYWNSPLSYHIDAVVGAGAIRQEPAELLAFYESVFVPESERLSLFLDNTDSWNDYFELIIDNWSAGQGSLEQDLPNVDTLRPDQLYAPLLAMLEQAEREVLLSTAYLIPDQAFMATVARLRARGVRVVLLTNSMASNNHMVAHLGYKMRRKELLDLGVELYESRTDSTAISDYAVPPTEPGFLGLHSKAIVVDGRYSFVGSPNIDPRSLIINTEIGVFVDSVELARDLSALIERDIAPEAAWRVHRNDRGRLRWTSSRGTEKNQPALGLMQRVTAFFLNLLPIKSQA